MTLFTRLMHEIRTRQPRSAPPGPEQVRAWVADGRIEEAEATLRSHLAGNPAHVDSLQLLGHLKFLRGEHREAARLVALAVDHAPQVAFLRTNLAEVFAALGRHDDAETQHRAAVALAPSAIEPRLALARCLAAQGKADEALECVRRILETDPAHAGASSIAAAALAQTGATPEAIALLRRAGNGDAENAGLRVQRFLLEAEICDWSQDRDAFAGFVARWAESPRDSRYDGLHPFVAWHVDVPERVRLAIAQGYADRIIERAGYAAAQFSRREAPRADGRIRLGYLSADFHNHPTMHLLGGMFAIHDRKRFEVFAYSLGPDDGSEHRRRVAASVDRFAELRGATAVECLRRIDADGIDVLVDLKGYTLEARPEILAMRAAPVQITWIGYPATLGAGLADYAIVDNTIAPQCEERVFGESLIRMPHSYQPADETAVPSAPGPARPEMGLPENGIVFACFNTAYKIEPRIFSVWMRILARVDASVLWLYRSNRWCEENLRREAHARGIDPARLVFADTLPRKAHLARLRNADLILDTHFINAHTGAADALLAGVPLVTCPGSGFPSRVAASALSAAGQRRLICNSLQAYEECAVELARMPQQRAEIREQLARRDSRYFDSAHFVRALEQAYETAWRRHAAGQAPADFDVQGS